MTPKKSAIERAKGKINREIIWGELPSGIPSVYQIEYQFNEDHTRVRIWFRIYHDNVYKDGRRITGRECIYIGSGREALQYIISIYDIMNSTAQRDYDHIIEQLNDSAMEVMFPHID